MCGPLCMRLARPFASCVRSCAGGFNTPWCGVGVGMSVEASMGVSQPVHVTRTVRPAYCAATSKTSLVLHRGHCTCMRMLRSGPACIVPDPCAAVLPADREPCGRHALQVRARGAALAAVCREASARM